MIAGLMLFIAYILPLPIAGACLYYHLYEQMEPLQRIEAIAATSLLPSALLMIFALKRIVHTIVYVALFAGVIFGAYRFGLIGGDISATTPGHARNP